MNEGDSPIRLYPGQTIAQLAVHALPDKTFFVKPDANYRAPTGPQAARLAKEQRALEKIKALGTSLDSA